jgi:hypothetical protein
VAALETAFRDAQSCLGFLRGYRHARTLVNQ